MEWGTLIGVGVGGALTYLGVLFAEERKMYVQAQVAARQVLLDFRRVVAGQPARGVDFQGRRLEFHKFVTPLVPVAGAIDPRIVQSFIRLEDALNARIEAQRTRTSKRIELRGWERDLAEAATKDDENSRTRVRDFSNAIPDGRERVAWAEAAFELAYREECGATSEFEALILDVVKNEIPLLPPFRPAAELGS